MKDTVIITSISSILNESGVYKHNGILKTLISEGIINIIKISRKCLSPVNKLINELNQKLPPDYSRNYDIRVLFVKVIDDKKRQLELEELVVNHTKDSFPNCKVTLVQLAPKLIDSYIYALKGINTDKQIRIVDLTPLSDEEGNIINAYLDNTSKEA